MDLHPTIITVDDNASDPGPALATLHLPESPLVGPRLDRLKAFGSTTIHFTAKLGGTRSFHYGKPGAIL